MTSLTMSMTMENVGSNRLFMSMDNLGSTKIGSSTATGVQDLNKEAEKASRKLL